jgi:cytoskeletal protein CcmA (bactofilin family)
MFGRKAGNDSGGFGGFLAEGAEIDGEVRFGAELRIDGRVTGRVVSQKGRLIVGDSGNVEADIEVGSASIGGTVIGTLVANQKVEIHSTGKVYGNINAPTLIIEEGAIFEGHCEMAKAVETLEPKKAQREDTVISAAS